MNMLFHRISCIINYIVFGKWQTLCTTLFDSAVHKRAWKSSLSWKIIKIVDTVTFNTMHVAQSWRYCKDNYEMEKRNERVDKSRK